MKFRYIIFQIISVDDGWVISCELALRLMSLVFTDDKSTLVQVVAWFRQARSQYLNQCLCRSLSSYAVTRPQWVANTVTYPSPKLDAGLAKEGPEMGTGPLKSKSVLSPKQRKLYCVALQLVPDTLIVNLEKCHLFITKPVICVAFDEGISLNIEAFQHYISGLLNTYSYKICIM